MKRILVFVASARRLEQAIMGHNRVITTGRSLLLALTLLLASPLVPEPAIAQQQGPVSGLPLVKPWLGDFEAMRQRRVVRILVPYSKTLFFIDRGREIGVAAELGRRFERWLNGRYKSGNQPIQVVFVPTRRDRILLALTAGLGDIAAANLTITVERAALVAFAPPWTDKVSEIVVTGPSSPPARRARRPRRPRDPCPQHQQLCRASRGFGQGFHEAWLAGLAHPAARRAARGRGRP